MSDTVTEIISRILVDGFVLALIGLFFYKREVRIEKTIEEEFKKRDKFYDARFNFKLRSLEELLAPVKLQMIRSLITLRGYDANNEYREKILKECNEKIRDLLLTKGHLIPASIIPHAEELIKHYDEWLQAYRQSREVENKKEISHVFTYNFPHASEKAFLDKFEEYRRELEIEGSLK